MIYTLAVTGSGASLADRINDVVSTRGGGGLINPWCDALVLGWVSSQFLIQSIMCHMLDAASSDGTVHFGVV